MRRRVLVPLLVVVALLAAASLGYAAAANKYQFTGSVKSVDGKTLAVTNTKGETWEFSEEGFTGAQPKVGDKVTVYYRMLVTSIEAKAAPEKKPK